MNSIPSPTRPSLQERLGYVFSDAVLLEIALTHSTYANENRDAPGNNERLEFVGDAVLDVLAAKLLYTLFPHAPEGDLSRRRARVVRREALAKQARGLGLEGDLRVGLGQRTEEGGINDRLLADACEAVAGAVYLDGGFEAVEKVFGALFASSIEQATEVLDFKTDLQQRCHLEGDAPPEYRVVRTEGPDHARVFTCGVWIAGEPLGEGQASTKKNAEQIAAREALLGLGNNKEDDVKESE